MRLMPLSRINYTDWIDIRNSLHGSSVCTLNQPGKGACNGDSGGPLISKSSNDEDTFIGVASWCIDCAEGYPDIFTSVLHHLDFIRNQMTD